MNRPASIPSSGWPVPRAGAVVGCVRPVEPSHRIDAVEFYRLLDGVVIDDTELFSNSSRVGKLCSALGTSTTRQNPGHIRTSIKARGIHKVYDYFVFLGRGQKRTDCTQRAMLISRVEELVEDHYLTVQPEQVLLDHVRTALPAEIWLHSTSYEATSIVRSTWPAIGTRPTSVRRTESVVS